MNTSMNTRVVALSVALAAVMLGACDRRPTDGTGTPSTATTPAPMPPASAASR